MSIDRHHPRRNEHAGGCLCGAVTSAPTADLEFTASPLRSTFSSRTNRTTMTSTTICPSLRSGEEARSRWSEACDVVGQPEIFMHAGRRKDRSTGSAILALLCLAGSTASRADNFRRVSYDPATDELVIVVVYRGSNPDHQFSLQWDACKTADDGRHEIVGELLDQQWRDSARKDYTKTLHFSIADLDCRPAAVTLRTAPRFYVTLQVPARSANPTAP